MSGQIKRHTVAAAVSLTAIGALVAVMSWAAIRSEEAGLVWLDLAVAAVSLAVTALVIWRPVAGGLAAAVLAALSPVATPVASFAALHTARRKPLPQAVLVAVAGVLGQAGQGLWRPIPGLPYGWWLVLMAAAYAALLGWGVWAQARQNLLEALRERASRAEREQAQRVTQARQEERARIAREMHDVLAHRLSLLAAYAGAVQYRPDAPPERLTAAAGVIRDSAHLALDELREVITLLRRDGTAPEDGPAGQTLQDIPRLVQEARTAGQPVGVDDRVGPAEVPLALGRTAFRVVQEALTNARKHAPGQRICLTIEGGPGSGLTIEARNGTVAVAPRAGSGTGLVGLAERAALAGGSLEHEIDADGEFRLTARLPWQDT